MTYSNYQIVSNNGSRPQNNLHFKIEYYVKELCPEATWGGGLNKAALLNRKKAMAV